MTTIGVEPVNLERVNPMNIPSYSYQYPSFQRVQLAAVKEGLFHPKLPSFRRMDMDTAGHKLPDEHCRTTTSCGPETITRVSNSLDPDEMPRYAASNQDPNCLQSNLVSDDFHRATSTLFEPPKRRMSALEITSTGKQIHRNYTTPEELKRSRTQWSDFLNRSPERFNIRVPDLPGAKDQHFVGYAVRYLRPEVTKSWKYTLTQDPSLDQYGQRPMPANVFARYRDTYPQYSRNIATEAWR